jgi:hypothetical protein
MGQPPAVVLRKKIPKYSISETTCPFFIVRCILDFMLPAGRPGGQLLSANRSALAFLRASSSADMTTAAAAGVDLPNRSPRFLSTSGSTCTHDAMPPMPPCFCPPRGPVLALAAGL